MVSTLAMSDALSKLLIEKGVITDEEFDFSGTPAKAGGSSGSGLFGPSSGRLPNRHRQKSIYIRVADLRKNELPRSKLRGIRKD